MKNFLALLALCAFITAPCRADFPGGVTETPAISGTDGTQAAQLPGGGVVNIIGTVRPIDGGTLSANAVGPGSSGTGPGISFPILSGTLQPPNLPAANPLTEYYSLLGTATAPTTGTAGYVYIKETGTGSAGWGILIGGTNTSLSGTVQ